LEHDKGRSEIALARRGPERVERKKEKGRRKKEEGKRKKEKGRRKKEKGCPGKMVTCMRGWANFGVGGGFLGWFWHTFMLW
jgi:hypothetical protein